MKAYSGSLDCAKKLTAAEGPGALFKGLPPALVRQSTYGSLRYGLYGPIKDSLGITPGQPVPLWKKIVAGGTAGAVASAVANPTDLMKVRLQTDGMMKDAEGNLLPKRYSGMGERHAAVDPEAATRPGPSRIRGRLASSRHHVITSSRHHARPVSHPRPPCVITLASCHPSLTPARLPLTRARV